MLRWGKRIVAALWLALAAATPAAGDEVFVPDQVFGLVGYINSVAYAPDGRSILLGGTGAARVDADSGEILTRYLGHASYISSVAFSPDGARVLTAGAADNTAKLWDTATGAEIRTFASHDVFVSSVAFSSDGAHVLTGSWDKSAKLWDADTGTEIRTFAGHTDWVRSVAFSPDGTQVLTGAGAFDGSVDNTAKLWDAETGAEVHTFVGHANSVISVAFSPDGTRVLTGSQDSTAKLWDAATGAEIRTFTGHTNTHWVSSVAFSPDGARALTGSYDETAKLWDVETGAELRTFSADSFLVSSVAISPNGAQVLIGSGDSTARVWDVETGVEMRAFAGHAGTVHSAAFSPDGARVLTGAGWYNSDDNTAKLWDAATSTEIRTFSGHTDWVNSVAFSPDGARVLTGAGGLDSLDNTAKLWDASTGAELRTFSGHTGNVNSVSFSPDGAQVLTGADDATAKLWDADTGAEIRTFSGHTGDVNSVAFSPDGGRVLTGAEDTTARLWNAETGVELRTFSGHAEEITSVAFSPDGARVLTGSLDESAKLWNAETGGEIRNFSDFAADVTCVAFSPDGLQLLTGSAIYAMLWDTNTGAKIRAFSGHTSNVDSVAFSPDGARVLTGSWDVTAMLWDIANLSGSQGSPGDTCETSLTYTGAFNVRGDTSAQAGTESAVADDYFPAGSCLDEVEDVGEGPDLTYAFAPLLGGVYDFTLEPDDADLALYIVTDCDDVSGTCLGLSDATGPGGSETVRISAEAGTTYYAIVDGVNGSSGAFDLFGRFAPEVVEETAVVSGTVRHRNTNAALSGVRIEALAPGTQGTPLATGVTLSNGSYTLELPASATPVDVVFATSNYDTRVIEDVPVPGTLNTTLTPEQPVTPTGLSAEPGAGRVRLRWNANKETDLAGYHVYRRGAAESELERIRITNAAVVAADYADTTALAGETYVYRVSAIDTDGNESGLSDAAEAAPGSLRLWIPDVSALPEDERIRVQLNLANADGASASGVQLILRYPTDLIGDAVGIVVERTALTRFTSPVVNTPQAGRLIITTVLGQSTLSGEGHLFDVYLPLKPGVPGGAAGLLEFENAVFADIEGAPLPVDYSQSGTLRIEGSCREGDLNGDLLVNVLDTVLLLRAAAGLLPLTPCIQQAGDLNGDGDIDSADVLMLQRTNSELPINPIQAGAIGVAPPVPTAPVGFRAQHIAVQPGGVATLLIEAVNTQGLTGLDFEIGYPGDATLLELESAMPGSLTEDFTLLANTKLPGAVRVSLSRQTALSSSITEGPVLRLDFRVGPGVPLGEVIPVTLNAVRVKGQFGDSFTWYTAINTCDGSVTSGNTPLPDTCILPTEGETPIEGEGEGDGTADGEVDGEGETEWAAPAAALLGGFAAAGGGTISFAESGLDGEIFAAIDLNFDGELSFAELQYAAGALSPIHSADTDADGTVSLAELLRLIQLYNAGGYGCDATAPDGYAPGEPGKGLDTTCPPHASDYLDTDGLISLSELLRLVQYYNLGAYSACPETAEDRFCPVAG